MNLEKIVKSLLFPHIAVLITLLPTATVLLVYSMVFLGTESPVAIASYVIAFYTLLVWCVRIPEIVKFIKSFKNENKYARLWREDMRLRTNVLLYGALIWNTAYSVFQLGLGFYHSSFWFFSMAGYYLFLAVMRFFLLGYTRRNAPGENMQTELGKYRLCGFIFLAMNLAVSLMIFFMVYWERSFHHHEITTITLATYTFFSFTAAMVNLIKYRKYKSPVYFSVKAISLAASCVSMLTLESTMLTTFGDPSDSLMRKVMLTSSGCVISVFIIAMALFMIIDSTKKQRKIKQRNISNG